MIRRFREEARSHREMRSNVGAGLLAKAAVNSPKVKRETHHPRASTDNQEGTANGLLDFWKIGYLCRPVVGLT